MESLGLSQKFGRGKLLLVTGYFGFEEWLLFWLSHPGADACVSCLAPAVIPLKTSLGIEVGFVPCDTTYFMSFGILVAPRRDWS